LLTDEFAEEVLIKRVVELEHPNFVGKEKIFLRFLTTGAKRTFKEGREEGTKIVKNC